MTKQDKLDGILSQAFREYAQEKINTHYADNAPFETSASFDRKMRRMLRSERNVYYKLTLTRGRRVLCACVMIIILLLSLLSVEAVREAVGSFIIKHFSNYNSIAPVVETDSTYPSALEVAYVPEYIPSGYVLTQEDISDAGVTQIYSKGEKIIMYDQSPKQGFSANIDNERSELTEEIVDGQKYYINVYGKNDYDIFWDNGGYVFSLSAELPKDTMLNMCKSLKIKE